MANRLVAEGEQVELLGMMGTVEAAYNATHQAKRRQRRAAEAGEDGATPSPTQLGRTLIARVADQRTSTAHLGPVARVRRVARIGTRYVGVRAKRRARAAFMRANLVVRLPVHPSMRDAYFRMLHSRATASHHTRPYAGPVVLWVGNGVDDRLDLGWADVVDDLHIRVIPGEHRVSRDLAAEPYVDDLTRELREELARLDGADAPAAHTPN
jgi:thioesterase domain-containing protein